MLNKTIVYVKKFPFKVENMDIDVVARKEEIESCTSQKVKDEKYYVWKLLEEVVSKEMGQPLLNFAPKKIGDRWCVKGFDFSLSHTGNFVCVAVSDKDVGVDLEHVNDQKFERLSSKILHTNEDITNNLCTLWTGKEAIFKSLRNDVFVPSQIDTTQYNVYQQMLNLQDKGYSLSVATSKENKVEVCVFVD